MRFKTATIFLQKMMQVLMMSALLSFCCVVYANEHKHEIRIGILAKRGIDKTLERWKPMSDFLNERMENHTVTIVALPFDKVETAIANKNIDFILTNSSHYVTLEMKYGVSPIATMYNRVNNNLLLENFGGVIFTRSNRLDINSLKDTQGKRFAGVDELSFGGWQMAWRELKKEGIDPDKDFSELFFTQTHDAVVNAVLSGIADAGTVRTDTLEEMVREGSLDLKKIKIINPKKYSNFPLLISTPLYPEWPLAKLSGTPMQLAKEVAEVLFSMKAESNCSIESGIGGWTIAADYKPVHDALRELNIGPYKDKSFSIEDVLEKYWEFFIIIILVVIVILTSYIYLLRVQKITNKANKKIQELNKTLEDKVEERTKELNEINKTLEERVAQEVLKNRKKDEAILLQSRYAAMGEMLSMLAHQWRQPIAIIQMGVNNLILDMELGIDNVDDFKKELLVITNETEKLSNIIDDFSSKFKDDSTQQKIKPQNIMEEVLNVLEANLKYHKITIKKRYTNSSELTLIARQLFQVYLNLINNAKEVLIERNISFAKIIIVIEESAEEVVSHICDNGGGIEESNIQRIFEPYFSTKSEKNGCGLGLYICKTIVEKQLGGTISVKNSNTNACFTIRIPKKKANSEMS